jgi:feruloyl esterase
VNAAKAVIQTYYDKAPAYSYHEGCSTGGMQGLKETQRFPYDFDGVVVGDPVNFYQALNVSHVWNLQRVFKNNLEGMLAYDSDGDGMFESLTQLRRLARAVLDQCDAMTESSTG